MKYKPIKGFETFVDNPFIEKAVDSIVINKKTQIMKPSNKGEIQMVVSQDGEVQGYSAFMRFIEVDEDKFAKLYLSQFEAFWELSKPAIRVFGYIINSLNPHADSFMLRMDKCLEYTKYRQKSMIISGLSDLIENGIIAKSKYENEYFINPLVIFNGSRVTFAKTYIRKKKEAEFENKNQLNLFNQNLIGSFENGKKEEIQSNSEN
jgi:intergrase/recombinase